MYNFLKRFLDIVLSFISLIILLPIFIPIIIMLKFTAEGEVFYFQERIGINNSKFQIWKFATMLKNSMNMGSGSITLQNDFRVTKIGVFLRKTKINELPQIINILKGDSSLVGPRPLVAKTFSAYNDEVQSKIYNVVGIMSGTSIDGIDLSLIKTDGKKFTKIIFEKSYKYSANRLSRFST